MKHLKPVLATFRFCLCAASLVLAVLLHTASAQTIAYDDAGNYLISANWTNGANGGFGFTPWAITTNGPNSHGNYIGSAVVPPFVIASITNVSSVTYTDVFGIYANGTAGVNDTSAYRGFANPLGTNTFKIQWGSRGAGSTTVAGVGTVHGWCGFTLRNGNATNSPADFQTGVRFYLYFLDGAAPSTLYVWDGNGVQSLAGTSFSNLGRAGITNAIQAEVTVGPDNNTYHLVVKDFVQNKTLYTLNSTLLGSGTIDSVALFAHETTGDQIYNRPQISVPTLVPPTVVNVQPTNGSVYLPAATPLTFEVDSFNSTVASSFVSVYLNGALLSGTTFSTASPTNQLFGTNNAVLATNTFYNYTILAQDANGNVVSNGFTFNTFSPNNPCIEAEDYNNGAGSFFATPTPDQYAGLLGTNGIDYLDLTTTTNWNDYRPDTAPVPQVISAPNAATDEPLDHNQYFENSTPDWQIAFTDTGEWLDYTRNFSASRFTIYARAASASAGAFQVDRLVSATATTTNQPRAAIGACAVPNTGGSKVYNGQLVPVADIFGNAVVMNFTGTNTLRTTSLGNRTYNLNYLMLVPNSSTNVLRPYISVASPAPAALNVAPDTAISFTIASRQTAVVGSSIKLLINSNDVTASLVLSSNAVGIAATYTPPVYLAGNTTNFLSVIFNDTTGTNLVTNSWSFATVNLPVVTLTNGLPSSPGVVPGFALNLYKIDNTGPAPATVAAALLELNGLVTNVLTSTPYPNTLSGSTAVAPYTETNTLNYDTTGLPTGTPAFTNKSGFPLIPTDVGAQNNFVVQALFYIHLTAGNHHLVVRSDDGFALNTGATPSGANLLLGQFNGGRGNAIPSDIYCIASTNGYYPMNLLYFQEGGGGNLEFYSVESGTNILINDYTVGGSVKTFAAAGAANPVVIHNLAHVGTTSTFNFLTQLGFTHYVEYKNALTSATWGVLLTVPGTGSTTNISDPTATNSARFYRVRTQ